jgi:hypothetical protein
MSRQPYFPTSDFSKGGTIGQCIYVPVDAHEGEKRAMYQRLRDDFAVGLMEAIERSIHPVVVEVSEN